VLRFDANGGLVNSIFSLDTATSPMDLAIGPNGNVPVSSEYPFGALEAATSVREYDQVTGSLVRVFAPATDVPFRRPRGLRFDPDGPLHCVVEDSVVVFDYDTRRCHGAIVHHPRLNGQAIGFFGYRGIRRGRRE
jgi:hypothetical protein